MRSVRSLLVLFALVVVPSFRAAAAPPYSMHEGTMASRSARSTRAAGVTPAASLASDPFLKGAQERGNAARWTHDEENVGSAMLGRLEGEREITFADGTKGRALVFAPAVMRQATGEIVAHRQLETIFSATLQQRINPATDKHVVFAIRFDGFEKSKSAGRSDFKTFTVGEQSPALLVKQLTDCNAADLAQSVRSAG